MKNLKQFIEEVENTLSEICAVEDLIKLGLIENEEEAELLREKNLPPQYIQFSSLQIIYTKKAIMAWLWHKYSVAFLDPTEKEQMIIRMERNLMKRSKTYDHIVEINQAAKEVMHPRDPKKERWAPSWINEVKLMDEDDQRKLYAGVIGPVDRWEAEDGHKRYPGAFMTIKGFAQYYPSFTEQFFRTRMKSKDFIDKVVRRINKSVFIGVEEFWGWIRDCPKVNLHGAE